MAIQLIDPRRKHTTLILLLFCNVKLSVIPMDYLSLNPHQRSFEVESDKDKKSTTGQSTEIKRRQNAQP